MLKIVRAAHCTCLTLACCLLLPATRPTLAQTSAAVQASSAATPLLTPEVFAALGNNEKTVYLQGVTADWYTVADGHNFAFLRAAVDTVVTPTGGLSVPVSQALPFGRTILLIYRATQNPIFYQAAKQLRNSLQAVQEKGDMSTAPFLADFGVTFQDLSAADQAADALLRVDTSERDLETGLLKGSAPGLDLSRNTFYALDLMQAIDRFPIGYHHRRGLTEALNKTLSALIARQGDREVWQTPNQPAQTLLLNAYIVAHGVRLGTFAQSDESLARRMADAARSTPKDPASAGARLLAESEAQQASTQAYGQGKTVTMDAWYNARTRINAAGSKEFFAFQWDDQAATGFSFFGEAFKRYGVQLDTLRMAPTAAALRAAQVYFVVAPEASTVGLAAAHGVGKPDGDAIEAWVRDGGVLVLVADNAANADFTQLNLLADRFSMHFDSESRDTSSAVGDKVVTESTGGTSVFSNAHQISMKNTARLTLGPMAHSALKDGTDSVMAVASLGRGTVLAITNPWLANEYMDRLASASSDNLLAGIDLAAWLIKQTE